MKTDKELLELAAKAAGVPKKELSNRYDCLEDHPILISTAWNPLEDDGDALRLAVKLCIDVCSSVCRVGGSGWYSHEMERIGIEAATRRAIVKAAAEIGENL